MDKASFPGIGLHPHSGIATVSYLFEGSVRYEDSNGATGVLPAGGVDHCYNDGFVKLDITGDSGGKTWNWGYENSSQVPTRLRPERTGPLPHPIP